MNEDLKSGDHRGTSSFKGGRGIGSRATQNREDREKNDPRGPQVDRVKDDLYRVYGMNIGDTDFSTRGIPEGLSPAVKTYKTNPGTRFRIIGTESRSNQPGPPGLAKKRAEALKKQVVAQGVLASDIDIDTSPPSKADPKQTSSKTKAQMRGATVEVIPPPKKQSYAPQGFSDGSTYIKGEAKWSFKWPKPVELGPIRGKPHDFGGDDDGGEETGKQKGKNKKNGWGSVIDWKKFGRTSQVSPSLSSLALLGILAYFLPELLAAALIRYGKQYGEKKLKEFLEKKIKEKMEDGNERDRDGERFMEEMLRRILAAGIDPLKKHHPLYFLVDPETKQWKSRSTTGDFGVNAGHTVSHKGYGYAYAIEDAWHNQRIRADLIEHPSIGGVALTVAFEIGDVPVDEWTAKLYESLGYLPKGTVKKARRSPGWINLTGLAEQVLESDD